MGDSLFVVLLRCVFLSLQLCLPENSIVINGDFGVCSYDLPILQYDEWVDFNEVTVLLSEAIVQMFE